MGINCKSKFDTIRHPKKKPIFKMKVLAFASLKLATALPSNFQDGYKSPFEDRWFAAPKTYRQPCLKTFGDALLTEAEARVIAKSYGLSPGGKGQGYDFNEGDAPGLYWYETGDYKGIAYFGAGGDVTSQRIALAPKVGVGRRLRLPEKCRACKDSDVMIGGECYNANWN